MDEKLLKDAQFRKGLSIAFFNATNAAIEIVTKNPAYAIMEVPDKEKLIVLWRDWFINEHKNYYATVIANVGLNYDAKATIEKLKATTTVEQLKSTWQSLSADERQDKEIIKVTQELKKTYEKN